MEKIKKIIEKIRSYRTEIVIASSTTFILAGLYFQTFALETLKKNPWIFDALNPFKILAIFYRKYPLNLAFQLSAPYFRREFRDFLMMIVRNPVPQLLFFLILPIIILLLLGEDTKKYGFHPGDWKAGMLWTAVSLAVMSPFLYWVSTMPSFVKFYRAANQGSIWWIALQYGLYLLSWEFLFRGYLYFSLEERMGTLAIWIQSVPFAIAHLGKPPIEALTCYFGGLFLGYISMKTRSFLYAFLIHWGIYMILAGFIFIKSR